MKKYFLLLLMAPFLFACNRSGSGSGGEQPDPPSTDDDVIVENPDQVFVRSNVYDMAADDPIILGYQKAITQMQSLPADDPTSWSYQAAIHGTYATPAQPVWNQCQHGSFFFISWHRMYLYYFERIVRKYSENPDWALPYWNYSTTETRSLPAVFRNNNGNNPLYIPQRSAAMNNGAGLANWVVALDCLDLIPFTGTFTPGESFGGSTINGPQHFFNGYGGLESIPHNQVHNSIGGWMSDPNTAAQDPIFWLHHSNIDRLANVWLGLGQGRAWPNNATWLNEEFPFYDEDGNEVRLTGAQIVNSATQLGYRYDTDEATLAEQPLLAAADAPETQGADENKMQSDREQEGKTTVAQSQVKETAFTATPLSVALEMPEAGQRTLRKSTVEDEGDQQGTYLTVEGVKFDEMPNQSVGVFLNVPEGETPDFNSIHLVDVITFFGIGHHAHHMEDGARFVFRIDDTMAALAKAGIDVSNLQVTFALSNGVVLEGETTTKATEPTGNPRFSQVTIEVF